MELKRLQNQQFGIKSIFKKKSFKKEFRIRKCLVLEDCDLYNIDEQLCDTVKDETVFECNLPFKLEIKSECILEGIGKVEIKHVEANSDGSITYYIDEDIENEVCPNWIYEMVEDLNNKSEKLAEFNKFDLMDIAMRLRMNISELKSMNVNDRIFHIDNIVYNLEELNEKFKKILK